MNSTIKYTSTYCSAYDACRPQLLLLLPCRASAFDVIVTRCAGAADNLQGGNVVKYKCLPKPSHDSKIISMGAQRMWCCTMFVCLFIFSKVLQ